MRLSRTRAPISHRANGGIFSGHFRLMASLMILSGVFVLAPNAAQDWSKQAILSVAAMRISGQNSPVFRQWGFEALTEIRNSFGIQEGSAYAEEVKQGQPAPNAPAFLWSRSIQFAALAAAARVDPVTYAPQLEKDSASLRVYWVESNGLGGFDVLPAPKPLDRYYDDNAWMALGLVDAYQATQDSHYLSWAQDAFRFVESGEDTSVGGGIYWREQIKGSKNSCSTGPAALAALRLYEMTHDPAYLETGQRLYAWMNAHLQDRDGLFFDNITIDGKVDQTKWSYNSALMIEVNTMLYSLTGQGSYLEEAERIGRSAEDRWINPSTGAIVDTAPFAQHLADAFLSLYRETGDTYWLKLVERAVTFLHNQGADPSGHYGSSWGESRSETLTGFKLIDSASAARAYWLLARYR